MLKQAENQSGNQPADTAASRISRFGTTTDAVEAGRAGGQASVLSRRLRHQRQLEEKVLESRNGAAAVKLLEIRMRREAELEAERLGADQIVRHLTERKQILEEQLDEMSAQLRELDDQVAALEQRKQAAVSIDDTTLVALLREVGEQRVETALREIGWLDEDVDAT